MSNQQLFNQMAEAAADADVNGFANAFQQYDSQRTNEIIQRTERLRQHQEADELFTNDYADIANDEVLTQLANANYRQRVQSGIKPVDAVRQTGNELRDWVKEQKASGSQRRAHRASSSEEHVPTQAEMIKLIKKRRGK